MLEGYGSRSVCECVCLLPPQPSSFLDKLSTDERDSDRFILRRFVCKSSDSS
jgi:hypothetical protein